MVGCNTPAARAKSLVTSVRMGFAGEAQVVSINANGAVAEGLCKELPHSQLNGTCGAMGIKRQYASPPVQNASASFALNVATGDGAISGLIEC